MIRVHKPAADAVEVRDNPPPGVQAADVTVMVDHGVTVDVRELPAPLPLPPLTLRSNPIELQRLVCFYDWNTNPGNYIRRQRLTVWTDAVATVKFHVCMAGSSGRKLQAAQYTLQVYSVYDELVLTSTITVAAGSLSGVFTINIAALPEGWYRMELIGASTENTPSWFAYRYLNGDFKSPIMPVCSGSFDVIHYGTDAFWAWMPTRLTPTARPKRPRVYEAFNTAIGFTGLTREMLVPLRLDDTHCPNVDERGIWCTFNRQAYEWDTLTERYPRVHLLDGPRGVGNLSMATHLADTMRDDIVKTLFCDPWRVGHITDDGTIVTEFGFRHKSPPPLYLDDAEQASGVFPNNLELVGDWSAVPEEFRQLWECWGLATWRRSTELDPDAPPIGGEQPHKLPGVVKFATSPQTGCVLRAQYSHTDRAKPAVITVFAKGLNLPWDVVEENDIVYVSQQGGACISKFSAFTGEHLGDLVKGPMLAHWDHERFLHRDASIATIQAQTCVGPEGMTIRNGKLKFSSLAMLMTKEIDVTTGEMRVVKNWASTFASATAIRFFKHAESDGTFGPEGTVFLCTWSVSKLGLPHVALPDGSSWQLVASGDAAQGKGGYFQTMSYNAAVGVRRGRLITGAANYGVVVTSKTIASDVKPNYTLFGQGKKEAMQAGLHLLYGESGWDYYGLERPPVSAAVQYFWDNSTA